MVDNALWVIRRLDFKKGYYTFRAQMTNQLKEECLTTITHLSCEYQTNPLGIDVLKPRFSWRLQGVRPGTGQTAYHILAASKPKRLDSGQADLSKWIDPAQPGYKHTILRPQPGGGLTEACGKLQTAYGELCSEWQISNDKFEWQVLVPPNTTATAHLPIVGEGRISLNGQPVETAVHQLAAGDHHFIVD